LLNVLSIEAAASFISRERALIRSIQLPKILDIHLYVPAASTNPRLKHSRKCTLKEHRVWILINLNGEVAAHVGSPSINNANLGDNLPGFVLGTLFKVRHSYFSSHLAVYASLA
jgi:hypothetical protein